ncbi:MAG: hypothetical protein HC836_12085 [Richelia sp. RM2_1_2]|nr:hypothetical protein [Richelia sp. RM2_1_2]
MLPPSPAFTIDVFSVVAYIPLETPPLRLSVGSPFGFRYSPENGATPEIFI